MYAQYLKLKIEGLTRPLSFSTTYTRAVMRKTYLERGNEYEQEY